MKINKSIACTFVLVTFWAILLIQAASASDNSSIRPYSKNQWYWQYQGSPVVLLGGSDDHAIFQQTGNTLTDFLDQLVSAGGNYIRNVMSQRTENGVYPFKEIRAGVYDLNQWNDDYWNRLRFFLRETSRRNIVAQITLWDHGDLSNWSNDPWNPENNINMEPGKLSNNFGDQFFYYTVRRNNEEALTYQRAFVDKFLSVSLEFGNVLYNIQNDAHMADEWEDYWAGYIKQTATRKGKQVYITVTKHDPSTSVRQVMSNPDIYGFIEVSQNNQDSRGARGQGHWDNLMFWRQKVDGWAFGPMPFSNEQVHGALDGMNYSAGTESEAMNRMWRNIFAGCASSRFHRTSPPRYWGSGLNERARINIKAMRLLLNELDIFSCVPHNDLLRHRVQVPTTVEAYVTANIGYQYAVYFPQGRYTVNLDPWVFVKKVKLRWLDIDNLRWSEPQIVDVLWEDNQHRWGYRGAITLTTPSNRPYVALIEVVE
jgi:hypothetical protein